MYRSNLLSSFQFGTRIGDKIYGISTVTGILQEYNIISNEIRILGTDEKMRGKWAYSSHCCAYEQKFVAASNISNELLIYNVDGNEFDFITLKGVKDTMGTFLALFTYKNILIIIPKYDDAIVRYNIVERTIERIDCKFTGIKYDAIIKDNSLYILYETGKIIKVLIDDMSSQQEYYDGTGKQIIRLGVFDEELHGLCKHGEVLLITDCYCGKTICSSVDGDYDAGCFINTKKGVIVLPSLGDKIYLNKDNKWILIDKIEDDFDRLDDPMRGMFEKYVQYDDEIILLTKKLDRFFIVNIDTAETRWVLPKSPARWEYYEYIIGMTVIENEWTLSDLLISLKRDFYGSKI